MSEKVAVSLTRKLLEDNFVDVELFNTKPPMSRYSDWAIEMLDAGFDSSPLRLLCAAREMDPDEVHKVFRHTLDRHSLRPLTTEDRTDALQERVIHDFLSGNSSVQTAVSLGSKLYFQDRGALVWMILEEELHDAQRGTIPWDVTHFRGSDQLDARLARCLIDEGLVTEIDVMEINVELHQAIGKLTFEYPRNEIP